MRLDAAGGPHTFTVTVFEDAGNGPGFVPAANENVVEALTNANGAAYSASTPLTGKGLEPNGQFGVTFASATAGLVIGNASRIYRG